MRARWVTGCLVVSGTVLLVCSPACKTRRPASDTRSDEPPVLGPVSVGPIPPVTFGKHALRLDEAQLAVRVRSVLQQAGIFAKVNPKGTRVLVDVEARALALGNADDLEMSVKLGLRMRVRPEGGAWARFAEDLAAEGRAPLATRDASEAQAAFGRLAERTAEDLLRAYVGRQRLWSADVQEVARALRSSDNELRVAAVRVVGARKLRPMVPEVLRLLVDEDEAVRDAALGTLVVLGERSAVKAMATSRQMRDAREMRKVLDAIATLGGREAKEYLEFVAATHDDEEIREMARSAFERLERREASK